MRLVCDRSLTVFISIHCAHLKQLIWICMLPSEPLLLNKQTNMMTILRVKLLFFSGQSDDCDSVTPAPRNQCVVTWPATEGTRDNAEDEEGDVEPWQMGWNNGDAAWFWQAAPADQGGSYLLAVTVDLAKHQMLLNRKALLLNLQ